MEYLRVDVTSGGHIVAHFFPSGLLLHCLLLLVFLYRHDPSGTSSLSFFHQYFFSPVCLDFLSNPSMSFSFLGVTFVIFFVVFHSFILYCFSGSFVPLSSPLQIV